jgi:hypothetical protein
LALSHTLATSKALPNDHWKKRGLLSVHGLWEKGKSAEVAPIRMKLDLV